MSNSTKETVGNHGLLDANGKSTTCYTVFRQSHKLSSSPFTFRLLEDSKPG
jgi:hypothetical protein